MTVDTYQHGMNKRSVNEVFELVMKDSPTLLSLIGKGRAATNTKHEWIDDVQEGKSYSLASNHALGNQFVFNEATVEVGTVFEVEIADKVVGGQYKVTTFDIGTKTATVQLVGGTDAAIVAAGSTVIVLSSPRKEGGEAIIGEGNLLDTIYNYTQIFREIASVTKSQQSSSTYGIPDMLAYQEAYRLGLIARQADKQLIRGYRNDGASDKTRTFGGLQEFVYSVDGTNSALDIALFNESLQEAYSRGAIALDTIVAHPSQAGKFAAMKINVTTMRQDKTSGHAVAQVEGYLGGVQNIVWDMNQKKDRIDILDTSMIEMNYLREFTSSDLPVTRDSFDRELVGEFTVSVRNGQNCHIAIENLAV